ncbi:MAG TPA: hypothetical protein VK207_11860 [Bacteroidales bacterium]|nr:hypothetical protein [Bacteroidales bacterium]
MRILMALKTGAERMLRSWKNVFLVWFVMLLLVTAVVSPLRGALQNAFGDSMITEKLTHGIFPEAFTDLGPVYSSIVSAFSRGFFTLILISFLLNAFFTGGLFDCIKADSGQRNIKEFMRGCVMNFWSYFVILVISGLFISLTILLFSIVPSIFLDMDGDNVEIMVVRTIVIAGGLFILILPLHLLVADYARAWKAANPNAGVFKALGKGFSHTFGNFFSSWALMVIILLINALFLWLVLAILPGITPQSGKGIFLLFLLSQGLFIIRIMLRLLRYSSVTCMMEESTERQISPQI